MPLNATVIREIPGKTSDDSFQLVMGEEVIALKAEDKKSKNNWLHRIEVANNTCLKIEKKKMHMNGMNNFDEVSDENGRLYRNPSSNYT